ncbi:MAG TPA: cyclophilin-like fold protein [Ignavibacteria bacterium]|nr:cyclophilin-like fold protein [Ignavibacteria bacterium]
MRYSALVFLLTLASFASFTACSKGQIVPDNSNTQNYSKDTMTYKIKIKIGSNFFTATILNSTAATSFKEMLPMTINMVELNGNEKYFDLPGKIPVNASNPGFVQTGDLMLYGPNTLVLFYETFSTSYSYTKLGRIDDTSELSAAIGSGDVTVTLELL